MRDFSSLRAKGLFFNTFLRFDLLRPSAICFNRNNDEGISTMSTGTVTRADLAEAVYREIGLSRSESSELVESVLDHISDALLRGEHVKLAGFGTFSLRDKKERMGSNPKTGTAVPITSRRVLVFKPSQILRERVDSSLTRK